MGYLRLGRGVSQVSGRVGSAVMKPIKNQPGLRNPFHRPKLPIWKKLSPPGDPWSCLETFLVVTLEEGWHLMN